MFEYITHVTVHKMTDELLLQLKGTLCVTEEKNDTSTTHPRFCQYKYRGEADGCQEARRKRLLEEQKSRRENFVDYARRIAEGEDQNGNEAVDEMGGDEACTDAVEMGQTKNRKMRKAPYCNPYKNQLMLSEWMVDVPPDLEQNWMVVVCPIGKRCLIVASKGVTRAYSRTGQFLNQFPSYLPGGCKKHRSHSTYTILDCVYHEASRTYYMLDMMCWRAHPVYDSDLDFRLFWMKSKIEEDGNRCSVISKVNPYRFVPLDYHPSTREALHSILSAAWPLEVDGLLFLHRSSHYLCQRSPLAVWLKPHMVAVVLGIQVSTEFIACSPQLTEAKMDTLVM